MRRRTITRSRGERGFAALFVAIILLWLVQIALVVGGIYIAVHFILKFW